MRRRATRIDRSAQLLEGSEVTSGNIQVGPDPDRILEVPRALLREETERLLDSPQEALGSAQRAGAEDLDEGSGTDERLEAPLADILGGGA